MEHHFNVEIASQYGIDAAVLLHNIAFWTSHNLANGKHVHNGKAWTYNSYDAFAALFPYLTRDRVKRALKALQEAELIDVGNFNQNAYDRTNWYALTPKSLNLAIGRQCPIDRAPTPDASGASAPPIPDRKHNNKPDTPPVVPQTPSNFDEFWKAYPLKVGKPKALSSWKAQKLDAVADDVLAGLDRWKRSSQWKRDGGKFIPHPTTFLNQRRWEDRPEPERSPVPFAPDLNQPIPF